MNSQSNCGCSETNSTIIIGNSDKSADQGHKTKLCSYFEPCHEKTCLCHMQTTKAHISLHIHTVSAFVVHCLDSIIPQLAVAEISTP